MMKVNPVEELFKNSTREQKTPQVKLDKYGILFAVTISVLFSVIAMKLFNRNHHTVHRVK